MVAVRHAVTLEMPNTMPFLTLLAIAVALAAVNIFGGFIVTHRMLSMFKKKTK